MFVYLRSDKWFWRRMDNSYKIQFRSILANIGNSPSPTAWGGGVLSTCSNTVELSIDQQNMSSTHCQSHYEVRVS